MKTLETLFRELGLTRGVKASVKPWNLLVGAYFSITDVFDEIEINSVADVRVVQLLRQARNLIGE